MSGTTILYMNSTTLGKIAQIQTGYTFRSSMESDSNGNVNVIFSKHVQDDLHLKLKDTSLFSLDISHSTAFVEKGDIVFASRGKFRAAVVNSVQPLLASSSVFIIRVTSKKVLSEYLALYLNSLSSQKYFEQLSTTTLIATITKSALADTKISVPNLATQKNIVSLFLNIQEQKKLLTKQATLTQSLFESVLQKHAYIKEHNG